MSYRRLRAICVKELHHITRDARSLAMALAVPVMMLLLFGYALSLDVDRVPTWSTTRTSTSAEPRPDPAVQGSRYFEISRLRERLRGHRARHRPQPHPDGRRDSARLFGKNLRAGSEAPVQILLDGSDSNTASIALGYAEALVRELLARICAPTRRTGAAASALPPPVDARLRVWYNSSLESKNYVVPGLIAVILQIIAALLTSLTIAREWEMGTMEQLLSTPLRPGGDGARARCSAYFVVGRGGRARSALLVGVVRVRRAAAREHPAAGASRVACSCSARCSGASSFRPSTQTQLQAYQMGILSSFLPAFLLSGFVYSIETMPPVIQVITLHRSGALLRDDSEGHFSERRRA